MAITHFHSYLIHPGKNIEEDEREPIVGTELKLEGKLFDMFDEIYGATRSSCGHVVGFVSDDQQNVARNLIVTYAKGPTQNRGLKIAERLQGYTTKTPGIGLLFMVRGEENGKIKTLLSRFPADVGILAEAGQQGLNVEYLEKVFMKNSKKYKAAVYEDDSPDDKYWKGRVGDLQINDDGLRSISDYWVIDFLASTCKTTAKAGSARTAKGMRSAVKSADDPKVKSELVSAATLAPNLNGTKVSPAIIAKKLSLSKAASEVFESAFKTKELWKDEFKFDSDSFREVLSFETRELDNGAMLTAPAGDFDDIFDEKLLNEATGLSLYKTEGTPVDYRLKKAKP